MAEPDSGKIHSAAARLMTNPPRLVLKREAGFPEIGLIPLSIGVWKA